MLFFLGGGGAGGLCLVMGLAFPIKTARLEGLCENSLINVK